MRDTTLDPGTTRDAEAPGEEPTAGAPDMNLPGADHPVPAPDRNDDLPERLGERIGSEPGGIATGEPDVLPDVAVPETSM